MRAVATPPLAGETLELAGSIAVLAVDETFGGNSHGVHQRQVQVRKRLAFELQVSATLDLAIATPQHQDGNVIVDVEIAVAQAAAVQDDRMIEQLSVAIGSGSHLLHIVGE